MSRTQGPYLLDLMPLRRSSGLTCTSSLGFWSLSAIWARQRRRFKPRSLPHPLPSFHAAAAAADGALCDPTAVAGKFLHITVAAGRCFHTADTESLALHVPT